MLGTSLQTLVFPGCSGVGLYSGRSVGRATQAVGPRARLVGRSTPAHEKHKAMVGDERMPCVYSLSTASGACPSLVPSLPSPVSWRGCAGEERGTERRGGICYPESTFPATQLPPPLGLSALLHPPGTGSQFPPAPCPQPSLCLLPTPALSASRDVAVHIRPSRRCQRRRHKVGHQQQALRPCEVLRGDL